MEPSPKPPTKLLIVGQTPPPFHGQAIMIEALLAGDYGEAFSLCHVRMAFSQDMADIGKVHPRKIVELLRVIKDIYIGRFWYGAQVLYYPPAGPSKVAAIRDMAVLISTRWLFKETIFHFHASGLSQLYTSLSPLMRWLFRLAYFKPDRAIRLSSFAPDDPARLEAKNEYLIPYGIEDRALDISVSDRYPGFQGVNILFVGILRESKGVKVVLEAAKELRDRGHDFRVDFMGRFESSSFEEEVETHIRGNNLQDIVGFLGELTGEEKWNAYSAADIFCFPTFYESEAFSVVLVEALCFGLPVVATRWRGLPSIVEDGVCGYLLPPKDSSAVVASLERLIRDSELRKRMGKAGRERYLDQFTLDKYHQRLQHVFAKTREALR